ncbi:hypothetical protein EDC01DRAFT_776442 [Geopyxis carbonaria]|nr:hypothetical protein EDC01DRAFT_776442 [Geopyxis carbonaria]
MKSILRTIFRPIAGLFPSRASSVDVAAQAANNTRTVGTRDWADIESDYVRHMFVESGEAEETRQRRRVGATWVVPPGI